MAKGDVLRFDYTLYVEDDKKPTDTSLEAVAKEHGLHDPERRYRPVTAVLGQGHILPGLEAQLADVKKGAHASVRLAAKDAYGARDPKKIRDIPMAQFRSQKVEPKPGLVLTLQGERGVVTRVAGGRVRVDLNHDLAGKALRYEIDVVEVITDEKKRVDAVLQHLLGEAATGVVTKEEVAVQLPDAVKFDRNWPMAKFRIVADLRAVTGETKAIRLSEVYPVMPAATEEE